MRVTNPVALLGENLAADYLRKKGYRIIERNYRKRYGEIDIIAEKDNTLVFVEVKTRKSIVFGSPLEAITPWKLRELVKTAHYYSLTHSKLPQLLRIDAVTILLNSEGKPITMEHVENISMDN